VACGPEAILVVPVAAGTTALRYSLLVTGAIIILLAGPARRLASSRLLIVTMP
jgi:hypothetical protein